MEATEAVEVKAIPPTLPAEHITIIEKYVAEGWTLRERRRQVITIALTSAQVAELGAQAADLDVILRDRRQAKNAQAAAMQREKKSLEGAVTAVAVRIQARRDELGRALDTDALADYARVHAARSDELDRYDEQRKATLTELREELAEHEEQRKELSSKIRQGRGDFPVWLADFSDFAGGEVIAVRLDDGSVHSRRPLPDHDRQMDLYGSRVEAEPLTEAEYALAVSRRLQDAAWSYHKRTGIAHAECMRIIRKDLLPNERFDDELPPEAAPKAEPKAADYVEITEEPAVTGDNAEPTTDETSADFVMLYAVEVTGWNKRKRKAALPVLVQASRWTETVMTERLDGASAEEPVTVWLGSSEAACKRLVADLVSAGVEAEFATGQIESDDLAVFVLAGDKAAAIQSLVLAVGVSEERAREVVDGGYFLGGYTDVRNCIRSRLTVEVVEDPAYLA